MEVFTSYMCLVLLNRIPFLTDMLHPACLFCSFCDISECLRIFGRIKINLPTTTHTSLLLLSGWHKVYDVGIRKKRKSVWKVYFTLNFFLSVTSNPPRDALLLLYNFDYVEERAKNSSQQITEKTFLPWKTAMEIIYWTILNSLCASRLYLSR